MKYFSDIFKSEYNKNVLTLITGTTIAQAIPIAVTPILTRLYSPNDFGVFALFLAITAIAGAISNAQYEQAIILPIKEEESYNLVALGIIIVTAFSLLLLLLVFLFTSEIAVIIGNKEIKTFLYLIPLSTLLIGIYNSFNLFNIRKKKYKNISVSQITRSSSLGFSQILIGLITLGPVGLIVGQIVSYFSGNLVLFKTLKNNYKKGYITQDKIKKQAVRYKKFPFFSLPSILLNSINLNSVNLLIPLIFSIKTLGFYSLTQRIIGIPAKVIGSSFSQVYLQQASDDLKNKGTTIDVFTKTFKKLSILSVPFFIALYFLSEPIFAFIFGEEWRISGTYARILMPLAAIRFISSSLSNTLIVHQKQQLLLIFNSILFVGILLVFIISSQINYTFEETLTLFTIIISIVYILLLLMSWNVSKKQIVS